MKLFKETDQESENVNSLIFYTFNLPKHMTTYCLVRVRGNAQGFLQAAAVLVHAQGEVSVAFVHSRHPFFDLPSVTVAFLTEAVGQLDQQLHTLLSLLKESRKECYMRTHTHTQTYSTDSDMLFCVCMCVCVCE